MQIASTMTPFNGPPPFDPMMIRQPPFQVDPSLPFSAGSPPFNQQSMPASALQRLQLPQDKITETGIIPNNPYYKLPAAIMVPLVPAHLTEYKPIDSRDLRLPFPKFPDENFLRVIDAYYANDSDKRDTDGWDRKFIDTYLRQKEALSKLQAETHG